MKMSLIKKRGFTLIEVIISLAILGIIVAPFLSMILTSTKLTMKSEMKIKASNLAQSLAEHMKIRESVDFDLSSLGLKVSSFNKEKFKETADEDINLFSLYESVTPSEENYIVKIKHFSNISIDEDKGLKVELMDGLDSSKSELIVYNDGNQQERFYIDNTKGSLSFRIYYNNTQVTLQIMQGSKIISDRIIVNLKRTIVFKFHTRSEISCNITAQNEDSSSPVDLNIYKLISSGVKYELISDNTFNKNINTYTENFGSLNKGDKLELSIFDRQDNTPKPLQKLTVVRGK